MKVFDLYAERYDLWYDLPFGSSVFPLEVECLKRCGPVESPSLEVVVFPNSEGISWFDKLFSSTLRNLKPIKLEDPEFESLFNVYGEDQVESRYILSTSLMRRLVELWNRFKEAGAKDIRISFIDSYIFIAIDFRKDLLEPSLFSAIDYNRMWITYWRVKAFYDVVDDLNLNRRIWGKT